MPVTVQASPLVLVKASMLVYCESESTIEVCRTTLVAEGAAP
jgi:hypothetical protein